jgi:hypothetical protein
VAETRLAPLTFEFRKRHLREREHAQFKTHTHEVHTCEIHACEIHAYKMHAHKMHAHEVHAHEVHVHEMHELNDAEKFYVSPYPPL